MCAISDSIEYSAYPSGSPSISSTTMKSSPFIQGPVDSFRDSHHARVRLSIPTFSAATRS